MALQRVRLFLLISILFVAAYFDPFKIPTPIPISLSEQVSSQFLAAIVSTLSSILAIALAIIFIAFEIYYKTFHTYVKKAFLENKKFVELCTLYISSILFAAITLSSLNDSVRSFNLIYLSLCLFVLCLSILFPYTKSLLAGAISMDDTKRLIGDLDKKSTQLSNNRRIPTKAVASYIELIENDPLFILGEVGSNYVKQDSSIRVSMILAEVTQKFLDRAEKGTDFRELINVYIPFYRKIYKQALKTENEGVLQVIIDVIEDIHEFCATKKKMWHEMIELNEMMEDIISRCIRKNLQGVSKRALYMVPRVFEHHLLKNSPTQENIWDLNLSEERAPDKVDHDASLQWDHVAREYIGILGKLTKVAIEVDSSEIASTGVMGFHSMADSVNKASNLGDKQVMEVLRILGWNAKTVLLDCSKRDFWFEMVKITAFDSFTITKFLDQDKIYSNVLLLDAAGFQLTLLRNNKLPIFELNELGTAGRHNIREIKKKGDIYEKAVEFLVKTFVEMEKILNNNLKEDNYELYMEVYRQISSLEKWQGKKSDKLSKQITGAIKKFDQVKKIKKILEKDTIEWPEAVEK